MVQECSGNQRRRPPGRLANGLVALLIIGPADSASAASFDCVEAGSPVEKAICSDASLSELDASLSQYYQAARDRLADGEACLRASQRDWIRNTRNVCGSDAACLKQAYLRRLASLDALQPDMNRLRNVALPAEPALVTAIPPSTEILSETARGPLEIRGRLIVEDNDIANMGYAVRADDGSAHAIVLDADIGASPTHEDLRYSIEHETGGRFAVRGISDGHGGFAMDGCRFVYRLVR